MLRTHGRQPRPGPERYRPGADHLRDAGAPAVAVGRRLAAGRARRGAGHQEPGGAADQGRQTAPGRRADRADGHAGREPALRPVVAVRFPLPGLARLAGEVQAVRQDPGGPRAEPLRAASLAGAAVHPPAAEDRQAGHRRSAGEDGGPGLLRPRQAAGGPLCQAGRGTGRRRWKGWRA